MSHRSQSKMNRTADDSFITIKKNYLMKNKQVTFQDWGLIDYKEAWDRQEALFADTVDLKTRIRNRKITSEGDEYGEDEPTPNYLVFCEHPHVYTLGKSG